METIATRVHGLLREYSIDVDKVEYVTIHTSKLRSVFLRDIQIKPKYLSRYDKSFYNTMINNLPHCRF